MTGTHGASIWMIFALVFALGCTETTAEDAGSESDGGSDAGTDTDAGSDAGPVGTDAGSDAGPLGSDAGTSCDATDGTVISLVTDDGVSLEADLYVPAAASRNGQAVYLFHMIPPFNDRTNYPASFIGALTSHGFIVINVDRRGAGGSDGVATEAYTGPNGKLDVKAAVDFLAASACAPTDFLLVGASNGTTSILDYAVFAGNGSATSPIGLVFLTGGGYTEAQNVISASHTVLDPLPISFVYSTAEAAWSVSQTSGAPTLWEFNEYTGGDHGTAMFSAVPGSVTDVADWIDATASP